MLRCHQDIRFRIVLAARLVQSHNLTTSLRPVVRFTCAAILAWVLSCILLIVNSKFICTNVQFSYKLTAILYMLLFPMDWWAWGVWWLPSFTICWDSIGVIAGWDLGASCASTTTSTSSMETRRNHTHGSHWFGVSIAKTWHAGAPFTALTLWKSHGRFLMKNKGKKMKYGEESARGSKQKKLWRENSWRWN